MGKSRLSNQKQLAKTLIEKYGQTFSEEVNITPRNTPAPLFQILMLSSMLSTRIRTEKALSATTSLLRNGFTSVPKVCSANWHSLVETLTNSGYKRYDESTARQLKTLAETVQQNYSGDLRALRRDADQSTDCLRDRLQDFKGIGPTGSAIFAREIQSLWPEFYPFADRRLCQIAAQLGLPNDAHQLAKLCSQADFTALTAALMRVKLNNKMERYAINNSTGETSSSFR